MLSIHVCTIQYITVKVAGSVHGQLAEVLDELYSQLAPLSGVAVHRPGPCPSYVAWRAGMATPLSGLIAE